MQEDRPEGCRADAAQGEIAKFQRELPGAQNQRDGGDDEVFGVGKIHPVVHPDAGPGDGDQAEDDNGDPAHHRQRNGLDQRPKLGRKAQQQRQQGRYQEHGGGIDARGRHHADVFGIGGHAGATARTADHGGDAIADEGAAHVLVEVFARHGGDGLDVAQVLGHQDDYHRHDEQHGVGAEHRRVQAGQAQPRGGNDTAHVHRFAPAQAVGEHGVEQAGNNQPQQDQQPLQHAAREHGHQRHAGEGHGLHPGLEVVGGHVFNGNGCQVQANDGHDSARHHRRHEFFNPTGADGLHQQPHQGIDRAAGNDAAQRQADIGVGPLACVAGGGNHHANKGKRRAQVAGHFAAGDQKENQRANAAHQHGQIGVKPHQDRGQHGGAKHSDDVLHAHQAGLRPGQALIGADDPTALQCRGRFF